MKRPFNRVLDKQILYSSDLIACTYLLVPEKGTQLIARYLLDELINEAIVSRTNLVPSPIDNDDKVKYPTLIKL